MILTKIWIICFLSILAGITGSVNLNIVGVVNTAVYVSTGGEEEFGCGAALMYIDNAFRVSVSSSMLYNIYLKEISQGFHRLWKKQRKDSVF